MIKLTDISFAYHAGRPVIEGISWEVKPGNLAALMGPNGAGKSTLIKLLCGLLAANSGTREAAIGARVSYDAAPGCIYAPLTLIENLTFFAALCGVSRKRLFALIEAFEIEGQLETVVTELSAGQRRRGALVRALLPAADVYCLDEPFAGLDKTGSHALVRELDARIRDGQAVVLATHDAGYLETHANRWITLDKGRIVSSR